MQETVGTKMHYAWAKKMVEEEYHVNSESAKIVGI